jgi:hypothetical protein
MQYPLLFKEWIGKSPEVMYGFRPNVQQIKKPFYEDQPLEPFNTGAFLNELVLLGNLHGKKINDSWSSQLSYGDGIGKLSVVASPLGSFKIIVRRYNSDAEGNLYPMCRLIVPLTNDFNHRGPNDPGEEILAVKVFDKLKQINAEPFPSAKKNWTIQFSKFVYNLSQALKLKHPTVMNYRGTVRQNENNYILVFGLKGGGVGGPNNTRVEEFLINVQYLNETGLIHCWGYDVVSPSISREYYPAPSEWDEYFSPTQPEQQIISCILETFMTY